MRPPIGPSREYIPGDHLLREPLGSNVRWHGVYIPSRENIPARPTSDWSVTRIYPRVPPPIGPHLLREPLGGDVRRHVMAVEARVHHHQRAPALEHRR
eukprot:6852283-Pyramimonas_sp.AAC.1